MSVTQSTAINQVRQQNIAYYDEIAGQYDALSDPGMALFDGLGGDRLAAGGLAAREQQQAEDGDGGANHEVKYIPRRTSGVWRICPSSTRSPMYTTAVT